MAPEVASRLRDLKLSLGQIVWGPRGDCLFFEAQIDQTRNLWRIRIDPKTLAWVGGPERLTVGAGLDSAIAISPDGTKLAFSSRVERTRILSYSLDSATGRISNRGEALSPEGADAQVADLSPEGRRIVYRTANRGRSELWIHSFGSDPDRLRTTEPTAGILQPRWSRDGLQLAYLRTSSVESGNAVVVLAVNSGEGRLVPSKSALSMIYDWSPDGESFLVGCRVATRSAVCQLPITSSPSAESDLRVFAADPSRDLFGIRVSPDGRWVTVSSSEDARSSAISIIPATGGKWISLTRADYYDTKPRWAPDGRAVYFMSNRGGSWNVWKQGFDSGHGRPVGEATQVSSFGTAGQRIQYQSQIQFAVSGDRVIVPVTEMSGAVWILENVHK
ncbi:MAG: hypothetical protein ABIW19_09815 [Vicinamibacterales bacterium]